MNTAEPCEDRGLRAAHVTHEGVSARPAASERRRRIEAIALAILAIVPLIPHVIPLLRDGVPRFGLFGDFALLELATRHVWSGDTLVGPYSRFRWNHPGPLFFYVAAPFQAVFGSSSTGLYIATCFINGAAAAALPFFARLFARRAHALAALFVVFGWFIAFGNISANPWNPLVIVLPLMAFLLTAAMFAGGRSTALYPSVIFGALVAQSHVAAVSTIVSTGALALGAFLVGARRRRARPNDAWLDRSERRHLLIASALLLVLFIPPLVEQLTAPVGNLTKIVVFFLHREAPLEPLGVAARHWTTALSWMPDRILSLSLLEEGYIPLGMRWDPMPSGLTTTARNIAFLQVTMTVLCGAIAFRRRDFTSLWLITFGAVASVVALSALSAIVGPSYHYLVFWTTAASSVTWIGVLSTILSATCAASLPMSRSRGVLGSALVAVLGSVVCATWLQRDWLARSPAAPASRDLERDDLRAVHDALRSRLASGGATAIIHTEGAWDMASAMVLELEKDRADVRVPERDRWSYMGIPSGDTVQNALHVYFSTTRLPLRIAPCLELATKSGDISMYVSPTDVVECGEP